MSIRTRSSRYADDRYAVQQRIGFPWLRFMLDLEHEYRNAFVGINTARFRIGGSIGVAGIFGFIFVDQVLGMDLEPAYADALLMALSVPALALPLLASVHPVGRKYVLPLIQLSTLVVSGSVLAVIAIGRAVNPWFPYESLFLVLLYIYFISGLMFYQAIFCGTALWVAFLVTNWPLQDHAVLLYEGYYLFLGNLLGIPGLYLLERQARTGFLLHNELRQQAVLDSLTGVLNRRAFSAHLESVWLQAQRNQAALGLILVDMDNFKQINDSCGHPFGDAALQHVTQVLRGCAQRPLDAVGRYGGDEIIAVWYDVDPAWFAQLAQELPQRIGILQCGNVDSLKVAVSGGAVIAWPRAGLVLRDLVKLADQKLYEMKRERRGTIAYAVLEGPSNSAAAT